jgi:DNA replication licensing factor MCM6
MRWQLNVENSKFIDWQKVRVQENSSEIPSGSMPRTLDVILRHEEVEKAKAGDKCIFTGTLIVIPDFSMKKASLGPKAMQSAGNNRNPSNNRAGRGDSAGNDYLQLASSSHLDGNTYKLAFLACSVQSVSANRASTH